MSNIIELNIAEIDTVVGGANAIQTAMVSQTATALARPAAPVKQVSVLASSVNIDAMRARLEALI